MNATPVECRIICHPDTTPLERSSLNGAVNRWAYRTAGKPAPEALSNYMANTSAIVFGIDADRRTVVESLHRYIPILVDGRSWNDSPPQPAILV